MSIPKKTKAIFEIGISRSRLNGSAVILCIKKLKMAGLLLKQLQQQNGKINYKIRVKTNCHLYEGGTPMSNFNKIPRASERQNKA